MQNFQTLIKIGRFLPRNVICVNGVFAVARCLSVRPSVRLSVTLVNCIQTVEDIVKLFLSRPGTTIILVLVFFCPERRYPIPKRTPSAGAQNTRGWEKMNILQFLTEIAVYLGNGIRDRPMVAM